MNKAALVTGASDRIGKALVLAVAGMGFDIALHYNHSARKAEILKEEILSKNVRCELFHADFSRPEEVKKLIPGVFEKLNLALLINSASLFRENSLRDGDEDLPEMLFNINFKAPYILTREFGKRSEDGLIINLLDTRISKNRTNFFDYLLSKKFLEVFTRMSAVQLAPGIRVAGIAPGLILPPEGKGQDYLNELAIKVPLKRTGGVENIVAAVEYLVKNEFVTGQILYVDGGENL